jgi:hypothetical protein
MLLSSSWRKAIEIITDLYLDATSFIIMLGAYIFRCISSILTTGTLLIKMHIHASPEFAAVFTIHMYMPHMLRTEILLTESTSISREALACLSESNQQKALSGLFPERKQQGEASNRCGT